MADRVDGAPGSGQAAAIEIGRTEDLPAFLDLLEALGAWLDARGIPQWPAGSNRAQEPLLRHYLEQGALALVRGAGGIDAGCLLTRTPNPGWTDRARPAAYLHKLAVARRATGRGLAAALLDFAAAWTIDQGCDHLRLDCWEGSEPLRRYYRAAGFREGPAVREHDYWIRLFERNVAPIRAAGPDDAARLAAIHVACWRHAYREIIAPDVIERRGLREREALWRAWLTDPNAAIQAVGAPIRGFVRFGAARTIASPPPGFGEITHLYVDPAAAGQGDGGRLLAHASSALRAAGCPGVLLWTLERNDPARRFYERAGFRLDGARRDDPEWLGPGVYEVRYRRAFEPADAAARQTAPARHDEETR